ncbi:hypothetical protein BUALT_Bualt15G0090700 [Buddleja alternifolia]|uniref:Uncharacterized protein n=1 Tax=Buddleja alternifolia TaxID=168488 RepID=A0AAV6WC36_9LAMI|nr:hypothetical protein BUALT_Bualt15G0090700 [Buddleja alternifolia]
MNGYSKIKSLKTIDSSDNFLSSSPHTYESNRKSTPPPQESKTSEIKNGVASIESRSGVGAPVLRKNYSVSSFSSSSSSSKVSALKRAFSVGRSSSVTERYCRIHDQHVALASPPDDEDEGDGYNNGSFNKERKTKGGGGKRRIVKACKRIFGL